MASEQSLKSNASSEQLEKSGEKNQTGENTARGVRGKRVKGV